MQEEQGEQQCSAAITTSQSSASASAVAGMAAHCDCPDAHCTGVQVTTAKADARWLVHQLLGYPSTALSYTTLRFHRVTALCVTTRGCPQAVYRPGLQVFSLLQGGTSRAVRMLAGAQALRSCRLAGSIAAGVCALLHSCLASWPAPAQRREQSGPWLACSCVTAAGCMPLQRQQVGLVKGHSSRHTSMPERLLYPSAFWLLIPQ